MSDSFAIPWTVAHQAPLSMGFSRQEYWSGLPFPFPWGSMIPNGNAVPAQRMPTLPDLSPDLLCPWLPEEGPLELGLPSSLAPMLWQGVPGTCQHGLRPRHVPADEMEAELGYTARGPFQLCYDHGQLP